MSSIEMSHDQLGFLEYKYFKPPGKKLLSELKFDAL